MAPKSARRTSKAVAPPAAKKPRVDANLAGVLDALKQAEGMPTECRAMLLAGAPACLATPADQRHELQAVTVSWIDKVFDGVEAKLQEAAEAASAEVDSAKTKKEGLEGEVAGAQAAADARAEAVKGKDGELAAARQAVKDAKAKLTAAKAAQKTGDAGLKQASDAKAKLEAALAEHMEYLKKEEGFDPKQAGAHMKKLVPIAKQLKLDESLMTALSSASTQPPSKRGEFDNMVIGQLEAGIQGKADEHDATLKAGEAGAAERAAAVATAQGEVEEAEKAEDAASNALSAAKEEESAAFLTLNGAHAALAAGEAFCTSATSVKEAKAFALDNFKNYNRECFKLLRDGPEKEAAAAENEAEKEPAEKEAAAAEA
mmetsp:Transcript_30725/g.95526  ORF Transcript_30725/g.95526 Transcript_30725/m.95526 type:complete len:373 (-) Transcript_30725:72-1190(-)|eukprot:CAMPEP_0204591370 /NCGR_PEP_ID=MMETSP0661-20131031/50320_1 /ASSEMBLY_ACC=CAM_ASM_000606 /TAXON_ID=109239 /ORGANISM="Alexandrium margalefi, Strain AMGDE01CS-322" /LENGTH=372 /DNA_ID=CAMNT_0051601489 /DNA_START=60 /DNA_END=1178 /DNA_ORIENTATION=-